MAVWYKDFFDKFYLKSYKNIVDEERTLKEVNFIEEALNLQEKSRILDLCCGHGRHSIELAKRGYFVTGQDLNENFLKLAKKKAIKEKVQVNFICKEMRDIPFCKEFDVVINVFTSFGYLESDEEDLKVLQQISKALKHRGKFILDLRNRDWILNNFQHKDWRKVDELIVLEKRIWNSLKGIVNVQVTYIKENGLKITTGHSARLYTLSEINTMLERSGLTIQKVYGDFNLEDFTPATKRMIIISTKQKGLNAV